MDTVTTTLARWFEGMQCKIWVMPRFSHGHEPVVYYLLTMGHSQIMPRMSTRFGTTATTDQWYDMYNTVQFNTNPRHLH